MPAANPEQCPGHLSASKHLKIIPCEFMRQQQCPQCQHKSSLQNPAAPRIPRPGGGMDPDAAVQELVLPGGLLSPANKPMRSIKSQPEKASLTLCSSAHVDSLLLLVIWERVCRKKQKSLRSLIHRGVNALKLLGDTVTLL